MHKISVAVLAAACVSVRAAPNRSEQLRRELLAGNREMLVRDEGAVAEKFRRMAQTSFAFFRGSVGILPIEPSAFMNLAAARVAILGDPHPENVGTFRTAVGVRVVDFNDFDLAGYGPYVEDLRRLAVSLWLTADMADLNRNQRIRVIEEVCAGYASEIQALARGATPFVLRADEAFKGEINQMLVHPSDEESAMERGVAATPDERTLVTRLLAAYPSSLLEPAHFSAGMFVPKSVVRVHAGVSSFPIQRFRATVEGPRPGTDDDWVLELKETRGRSAAALISIQRRFQESPDDDALLGWAGVQAREFRVRRVSADQRRLSIERIIKHIKHGRLNENVLPQLAREVGQLLARGHAKTPSADGAPGLGALAPVVGDGAGLARETIAYTERAGATVKLDLAIFRGLLKDDGPLLGWRR